MDGWMDGWMGGWVNGVMKLGGCVGEWVGGCLGAQIDRYHHNFAITRFDYHIFSIEIAKISIRLRGALL